VGVENINPHEELKRLDEQIQSATEFGALKPVYFRLNEIIQAFPGDFDVQFTGNEIRQRLVARGTLLRQQEASPPPPPVPPPAMPAAYPPPLSTSFLDTPASAASAPPEAPVMPGAAPVPPPFFLPDSAPPQQPAPAFAVRPENPPQPPARPPASRPAPPRSTSNNRAMVIGPIAVLLVALVLIVLVVHQKRKDNANKAARTVAAVQVGLATTPPGASMRVAPQGSAAGAPNQTTCTSNCQMALVPGTYQVFASLDGFEPATGAVTVTGRQPAALSLTLQPQAQSVRLLTDLDRGKVVVDDRPPVDLQEGQLVLDKVAPGTHTVKVTGPSGDASFSFEIADARLPAVAGPVNARNMIAVLVASFGKQARLVTNAGPWKLAVNGQPQSDAGPAGSDLTGLQPGVNEFVVGEGRDQHNMSESFGPAPMLTAFLKTDVNAGTLIVSTGQDDVRVFLNDKEYRRHTQRGQLRLQTLGKVTVRVARSGFQEEPAQTVEVKKGAEVRLQFDLKPQPQFGSLQIHGAMAGTAVLIDQKNAGTVRPDGSFSLGAIPPGDHTIELRREQYLPKRLQRSIQANQAVVLAGADVVLTAASGTIRLTRNPASATITYRRGDETESHQTRGNQFELPPGSYVFSASATGFVESSTRVQLAAGENRAVDFALVRERQAAPPPVVAPGGMAEFEDAQSWKKDGDNWIHKGGGFVPYKLPPNGVFTFTVQLLKGGGVFRAGQIRWCLQYLDSKNYLLYEMDRKNFWAGVVEKGKRAERVKAPHNLGEQKAFTIQIEVAPDRLVTKVRVGDEWKVLDTFAEPGRDFTQGKFGFLIQGNDEIAISDFKFVRK
jgi:hypothetical protein